MKQAIGLKEPASCDQGAGFFTFSAAGVQSEEYRPFCYITIKILKKQY
ncbi:hypothetical protein [Paenibacillus dendritiformis]|nr:hypothetical protein [Paenibacillus dendritiformis]